MAGQRKTGETVGGDIRVVWLWVLWVEWFGFIVQHSGWIWVGWTVSFFLFTMVPVAAFLFLLCVPPLLSSFSSLLCLLSCLCVVVISLFVLQCSDLILPLFCYPHSVSYFAQFIAQSEWVLRPFPLTPTPSPPSSPILCSPSIPPPRSRSQSYRILYIRV